MPYSVIKSICEMLNATETISVNLTEMGKLAQGLVEKVSLLQLKGVLVVCK